MNMRASRVTFCATCVVERMVVTHFRKPVEGTASCARDVGGTVGYLLSWIWERVVEASNQNRHVTYESDGLARKV